MVQLDFADCFVADRWIRGGKRVRNGTETEVDDFHSQNSFLSFGSSIQSGLIFGKPPSLDRVSDTKKIVAITRTQI